MATGDLQNDVLLTREEVAKRLHVAIRTIDRWRKNGRIQDVAVGDRLVFISEEAVRAFLHDSQERRNS